MRLLVVVLLLICGCVLGQDSWSDVKAILVPACERYLKAHATAAERAAWGRKLDARIAQRVSDGIASDAGAALQGIALDWAADNRSRIAKKEPAALKVACLFFVRFAGRGFEPPRQVAEALTVENARALADHLAAAGSGSR